MAGSDVPGEDREATLRTEALQERLQATEAELAAVKAELKAVTATRVWRAWTRFRHGRIGRGASAVARRLGRRQRRFARPGVGRLPRAGTQAGVPVPQGLLEAVSGRIRALGELPADAALALYHPGWPGVAHAAQHLFDYALPIGEEFAGSEDAVAESVLDSGARTIVFNGLPEGWESLAVALKARMTGVRVLLLWQGTAVQLAPGPAAEQFLLVLDLCARGVFDRLGFGKEGMAEVFARAGIDTRFILNYVRRPPTLKAAPMRDGRTHIGIFFANMEWRKNIYSQLLAAALVPNAMVHWAPSAASLERLAQVVRLPCEIVSHHRTPKPPWEHMARMDCNLNIGLSECGPLMPLESLAMGVPCLLSSGSHLFRDHEYLHRRLCVDYHDNPHAIADAIVQAIAERERIIEAYNAYIPRYNARAQESVRRFLEPA